MVFEKLNLENLKGVNKCALAFSGGLDTSVIASIMKERGIEVVTITIDLGGTDVKKAGEVAKFLGTKHFTIDAQEEFWNEYIIPSVQANALYEKTYPNFTALGRPLIMKHMVGIAKKEKADAVAHGSTGKGNDQVRMDNAVRALAPELKIVAPVREWGLWREEEIEYAKQKKIPINLKKSVYSTDENFYGRSIECGPLEDPSKEPPEEAFSWTVSPEKAPDKPEYVELSFENGKPLKARIGEREYRGIEMVKKLHEVAGMNGIGRIDHMEDRVVGFKSREVYEAPAAMVLIKAHEDLEKSVLSKEELTLKRTIDDRFADLVYEGKWFTPLRKQVLAYLNENQKGVSGKVKLKLFKGSVNVVGRESPFMLYDKLTATYGKETTWNQEEGGIFTKLYGLQGNSAWHKRGEL